MNLHPPQIFLEISPSIFFSCAFEISILLIDKLNQDVIRSIWMQPHMDTTGNRESGHYCTSHGGRCVKVLDITDIRPAINDRVTMREMLR